MTIVQTLLVYLGIPVAVIALFGVVTMWPKKDTTNPRYRSGEDWGYVPVWWSANPEGLGEHAGAGHPHELASGTPAEAELVGGGARGTW